jgi:DNA (cytosine-5)-methyltransferase 1
LDPENIAGTIVVGGMGLERNLIKNAPLPNCWRPGDDPLRKKNCEGVRVLTVRECARLQGFPDSFKVPVSDTQAYKQFANSVAVPVIKAVAENVLLTLEGKTPQKR